MGGLEGASLSIKLKYLPDWNKRRQEIAKRYQEEIKNDKLKMQVQTCRSLFCLSFVRSYYS